jgi:hypothetical protein
LRRAIALLNIQSTNWHFIRSGRITYRAARGFRAALTIPGVFLDGTNKYPFHKGDNRADDYSIPEYRFLSLYNLHKDDPLSEKFRTNPIDNQPADSVYFLLIHNWCALTLTATSASEVWLGAFFVRFTPQQPAVGLLHEVVFLLRRRGSPPMTAILARRGAAAPAPRSIYFWRHGLAKAEIRTSIVS